MREIKFRAWRKQENKMIHWGHIAVAWTAGALRDDPFTIVMQYTGLKDRNSVEIYEGDLLIQQLIRYSPYHPNEDPEIVVFNTGCFCLAHKSGFTKRMNELSMVNEESEVIGNIYQNPELLK